MAGFNRREFMRRGAAGAAGLGLFLNGEYIPAEAAAPLPKPANSEIDIGAPDEVSSHDIHRSSIYRIIYGSLKSAITIVYKYRNAGVFRIDDG